jgi:hypothetical protein
MKRPPRNKTQVLAGWALLQHPAQPQSFGVLGGENIKPFIIIIDETKKNQFINKEQAVHKEKKYNSTTMPKNL